MQPERDALAAVLMTVVLVPGPLRLRKGEGIVLTSAEALRAADAVLASDWLDDHDRRERASALREAADDAALVLGEIRWLRERADRIEGER